ncbi:MAG: S53 family peptidase [Streptosporangiaceae bacterium]
MSRRLKMRAGAIGASAALVAMTTVGVGGLAQAAPKPSETVLTGSNVPFTSHTKVTGYVAGSQALTVQLWLKPDVAAAEQYATAVSTPGSRLFHHYLSPAAYTARFGASQASAAKVEAWLRGQGFTAIHTDAQRNYVRATASTADINAAFNVRLTLYKSSASVNAGQYALRANNRAVSLPTSIAGSVLAVSGLDNTAPVQPLTKMNTKAHAVGGSSACSQYYGQNVTTGLPEHFGTTSFPTEVCGYDADQLRAAYGATSANDGSGQTIALVELGLTKDMYLTLQDYAAANSMPAPQSTHYAELSLGKDSCGDPFDVEEQLDVESSYDMAPGANQLVVGGDSCNDGDAGLQGLFDADIAVIDGSGGHPLANIASNSWESGTENQEPAFTNIENAYLVRSAAEGVGMYFSAGDGSGLGMPSSDPYATAVGGTTLGIGKANNRIFETGWSTGISVLNQAGTAWRFEGEQGASGGGPSEIWAQPSYQKGVVPASLAKSPGTRGGLVRSVPDISADADPFTGMAVGLLSFTPGSPPTYSETDVGGTSEASPLVAGIVTSAQQGQTVPFGFLNPMIYKLYGTSAYNDTLPITKASPRHERGTYCPANTCGANALTTFDDQSINMEFYTGQVTLKGYDNMSGVGTPDAPNFITGLRGLAG